MVNEAFSVSIFCICSAIFAILLRKYCREQSLMISLAACTAIIGAFVGIIYPVVQEISGLFSEAGITSEYISIVMKAAAICFVTQITCELCRDSGENALASAAELWCRGALTVMSLPIVKALLEMITEFL